MAHYGGMKNLLSAAALLFIAATLSADITGEHFEPNVVRAGQVSPVKIVLHTDGMVPKYRIDCDSGKVVPMSTTDGGKTFSASLSAADVLFGYQSTGANRHHIGIAFPLDAAGNPIADMVGMHIFILVRDGNIPIVPISDLP